VIRSLSAALVLCALLAACGTSHSSGGTNHTPVPTSTAPPSYTYDPSQAHLPACAPSAKAIPFPVNFPQNFPVPRGTLISSTRVPIGGGIAAVGFVPAPMFNATVEFFPRQVRVAGFTLLHWDVVSPHVSEGQYIGHGFSGGWSLMSWCPGVMKIQISAKKTP